MVPIGHAAPQEPFVLATLERTGRAGATADRVSAVLTEAILCGGFRPGAHLNADTLARQLGLSHIPVREALRSLHAEGWVEMRPHSGAFVRSRTPQELADLFEMRLLLESQAAALAAERRSATQLDELARILDAQAAATNAPELASINEQFHHTVAACSHNGILTDAIRRLGRRARFYFLTVAPKRRADSLREHRQLTDAIRRRDVDAAATIARDHIAHTRADVHDALRVTDAIG
ncbi:GntR family transcriptional regulator [Verrucosispora sp. WMMA2121]|uniref:GntR family transcriptional regulator n=1 Tax=Verrucosispora sp. WMMA2121 TaxID=3015164 RepID=UPI0022B6CF49|nr:GntR family transcriptional regulator [Verrucosispora sp. WMMA2121]MCZ7423571.1 GntR family transcriptional regulator [Verrucosispora sp. WMMA2121]